MEVNQETAVTQFLTLARSCQQKKSTATEVVRQICGLYREVRITGADPADDGDMLLFQWGTGKHLLLTEPTDLRNLDDDEFEFDSTELLYLNFTRQVFVSSDEENDDGDDFDDDAIQMSLTLVYGPATRKTKSDNLWLSSPEDMDADLQAHATSPVVASLLNVTPSRYVATVESCG